MQNTPYYTVLIANELIDGLPEALKNYGSTRNVGGEADDYKTDEVTIENGQKIYKATFFAKNASWATRVKFYMDVIEKFMETPSAKKFFPNFCKASYQVSVEGENMVVKKPVEAIKTAGRNTTHQGALDTSVRSQVLIMSALFGTFEQSGAQSFIKNTQSEGDVYEINPFGPMDAGVSMHKNGTKFADFSVSLERLINRHNYDMAKGIALEAIKTELGDYGVNDIDNLRKDLARSVSSVAGEDAVLNIFGKDLAPRLDAQVDSIVDLRSAKEIKTIKVRVEELQKGLGEVQEGTKNIGNAEDSRTVAELAKSKKSELSKMLTEAKKLTSVLDFNGNAATVSKAHEGVWLISALLDFLIEIFTSTESQKGAAIAACNAINVVSSFAVDKCQSYLNKELNRCSRVEVSTPQGKNVSVHAEIAALVESDVCAKNEELFATAVNAISELHKFEQGSKLGFRKTASIGASEFIELLQTEYQNRKALLEREIADVSKAHAARERLQEIPQKVIEDVLAAMKAELEKLKLRIDHLEKISNSVDNNSEMPIYPATTVADHSMQQEEIKVRFTNK